MPHWPTTPKASFGSIRPLQSWNRNPTLPPLSSLRMPPQTVDQLLVFWSSAWMKRSPAGLPSGYLDGCLASSRLVGWLVVRGYGTGGRGGWVHSGASIAGRRPTVSDLGLDPTQLDRVCMCVCVRVCGGKQGCFQNKSQHNFLIICESFLDRR